MGTPATPVARGRPRALVIAYECAPGAGSEAGAGWELVRAALETVDCRVLVGPRHVPQLEAWRSAHPGAGLEVVPVADPLWRRLVAFHRIGRFAAYLAWLRRAATRAAPMVVAGDVDVAWHATYSAFWLPTPAVRLGLPSVWGPVGGAVTAPGSLRRLLGVAGWLSERLDALGVRVMAATPPTRRTWRLATTRLLQNPATQQRLPPADGQVILNHALFVEPAGVHEPPSSGGPAIWAGALERRKGPLLAVHALAAAPGVVLHMYGEGPERRRVERAARRLGVADRLVLRGRVPRRELLEALTGCACALFTGLYEEGGLALAEALATGVPTVVLDHGGAGTIARRATDPERVVLVPPATVAETARAMGEAISRFAAGAPPGRGPLLDREAAVALLGRCLAGAGDEVD